MHVSNLFNILFDTSEKMVVVWKVFWHFIKRNNAKVDLEICRGNVQRSMQCYLLSILYTLNGNKYNPLQIFTACNLTKRSQDELKYYNKLYLKQKFENEMYSTLKRISLNTEFLYNKLYCQCPNVKKNLGLCRHCKLWKKSNGIYVISFLLKQENICR